MDTTKLVYKEHTWHGLNAARYKQVSVKLIPINIKCLFVRCLGDGLDPQVINDEDNKWGLPTSDQKWEKSLTFLSTVPSKSYSPFSMALAVLFMVPTTTPNDSLDKWTANFS